MIKREVQLTSVKIDTELFTLFKIKCIEDKFNFSKLVTAAISLYLTDPEFKIRIQRYFPNIEEIINQVKSK